MKKNVMFVLIVSVLLVSVISVSLVSAESLGDIWSKITGRAVENETNASSETETEPEPEPTQSETCAASISMDFDKNTYNVGDSFKFEIGVFDSQGNPLSDYSFYFKMYDSMWHTPAHDRTGADGYFELTGTVEALSGGITKAIFKAYTEESGSCGVVEDTTEIEVSRETEESESTPSTEGSGSAPETCATEIKVTFDKKVYYIGDTAKIVIEVLDSQGNHLPNYVFNNQIYDGIWHTPGSEKTGSDGYFRAQPRVEKEQSKLGKVKFKVYTNEYSNCNSVEDVAELEIRGKEGESEPVPVPCGIGTCIPEEEEEPEEIPEDKIFYKCNGCELGGKCYPMGYRKQGEYCSEDYEFISQITGKCENSFECKSNLCISGECVEEGLMRRIIKWFKRLFGGDEEPEPEEPGLKMCSKLLIEKNIEDYKYFESAYGHKDHQVALYSEDGEQIDIVKCCVAGYLEDGEAGGTAAVVCPFDNKKDIETSLYWLLNKGEITLGEYKGQEVYKAGNAIVWTHKDFIVASGTDPKATTPLPEKVVNAYLDKYPNDLGEILG